MVKLTFFGGVNEIGGNKILLEDKQNDATIFLDFGMNFAQRAKYFEEFVQPRTANGILDFLEMGLIPNIKGIYRHDLLEFAKMEKHSEPIIDGIVLSHAHLDHSAHISFIDERVPIFTSDTTKLILKTVQETSPRDIENEIINFKERPIVNRKKEPIERNFPKIDKKFKINGLEIEMVPVDHSIPGACSVIVYASNKVVAYTGDLRMHGVETHLTNEFVEKLKLIKPDILLCEGTRIDEKESNAEAFVKVNCSKIISRTRGLVIADFAWKDTTRFKTFFEVAKKTGRKLAIPFRDAYYIRAMKEVVKDLPRIDDENILIYQDKRNTGTYCESDYHTWEREFLDMENTVKADYIHKHQDEIIIAVGYYDLPELIDLKPFRGSVYIKSASEAFNEEEEFDMQRLKNWLDHFGINYFHFHASGHADGTQLRNFVKTVKPHLIIPLHTEHANLYSKWFNNVHLIRKTGENIEIK